MAVMLVVQVAVMEVVDVGLVDDGDVAAAGSVGVRVTLGGGVFGGAGHEGPSLVCL